jgi:hypothetical protein
VYGLVEVTKHQEQDNQAEDVHGLADAYGPPVGNTTLPVFIPGYGLWILKDHTFQTFS